MSYPTLSDLNDPSLVPPLGSRSAPDIGPAAVMVSTEPDMKQVKYDFPDLPQSSFFNSTLLVLNRDRKGFSFAGPYIGAPYGVMLLESLVAKGARKIVVFGWCGAVTEHLEPGDLVVPGEAIADEGTSRNYMEPEGCFPVVTPSPSLTDRLGSRLDRAGVPFKRERIWTTDAIYRETEKKIDYFRQRGAAAVDMECSALFAAAEYRKIDVAALLVISDNVASSEWKPGFRKKAFKDARKTGMKAVIEFTRELAENGE